MNLRHFRYFDQELGIRLVDRTPRTVALTTAGDALLEEVRLVPRGANVATQAARSAGEERPRAIGHAA